MVKQVDNPRGTILAIDGIDLYFAPLSLGALELLLPKLQNFTGQDIGTVIDVAHKSLKRNYPEITREEVADMIYMDQLQDVMAAVMSVSGLKSNKDDASQGE